MERKGVLLHTHLIVECIPVGFGVSNSNCWANTANHTLLGSNKGRACLNKLCEGLVIQYCQPLKANHNTPGAPTAGSQDPHSKQHCGRQGGGCLTMQKSSCPWVWGGVGGGRGGG